MRTESSSITTGTSTSTVTPPPSPATTTTLNHQQHDPLLVKAHTMNSSNADRASCKNSSSTYYQRQLEQGERCQSLEQEQEQTDQFLKESLSYSLEIPADVDVDAEAEAEPTYQYSTSTTDDGHDYAHAHAHANGHDDEDNNNTAAASATLSTTPQQGNRNINRSIQSINRSINNNTIYSNSQSLINSFFEESDAEFLERGLPCKYDEDNNTPAATVHNTPHSEPLPSSSVLLSPPSIDLGRTSIDHGNDDDNDDDHDDHGKSGHGGSESENEGMEMKNEMEMEPRKKMVTKTPKKKKNAGTAVAVTSIASIATRDKITSSAYINIDDTCNNNNDEGHGHENDHDRNHNRDHGDTSPSLTSSSAAAALVAAGQKFQSLLPQLNEIAQQQQQKEEEDEEEEEQCENIGPIIEDESNDTLSAHNKGGIHGLIDSDNLQNTEGDNSDDDDCDGIDDTIDNDLLTPLCKKPVSKTTDKSSLVQSKSYHRRLHEAAQFAEAIGELPQDGVIQVIIDDDDVNESDDDDDEDDDNERNLNEIDCNIKPGVESEDSGCGLGNMNCNMNSFEDPNEIIVMDSDYSKQQRDDNVLVEGDVHCNTVEMGSNTDPALATEVEETILQAPQSPTPISPTPKSKESGTHEIFPIKEDVVSEKNKGCDFDNNTNTETKNDDAAKQHQQQQNQQQENEKEQGQQLPSFPTLGLPNLNYFLHHLPCNQFMVPPSSSLTPTSKAAMSSTTLRSSSVGSIQGMNTFNAENHYVYKGIRHNPPEITKRGIARGNYAQLHRKAWLEVSDKYHRYGKNLRLYYKHWESLGHPTNMFFEWLDSKGEAAGWEKPNLKELPRSVLDSDRVLYITDPETPSRYLLKIKSVETSGENVTTETSSSSSPTATRIVDCNGDVVRTGPNGWIFVFRDHELYGTEKVTRYGGNSKFRFHHSSFFGGKAVAAAGILITDDNGCLKRLYPHSGHYRPGEAHMQRMLFYLYQCHVDLDSFEVDMQQIMHVSREVRDERTPKGGNIVEPTGTKKTKKVDGANSGALTEAPSTKKAKKTESLYLKNATFVALFLAHKAKLIRVGVLSKIQKIRTIHASKRSARNVLNVVDEGGFWNQRSS